MSITVDLKPDLEEKLRAQAERLCLPLSLYVGSLLEQMPLPLEDPDEPYARESSLLEMEGKGAEAWRQELQGRDAQTYVTDLRNEWEHRP